MDINDEADILTAADVVREFGRYYRNAQSVYHVARRRKIPFQKVPGVGYRFSRRDIQAYLEGCVVELPTEAPGRGGSDVEEREGGAV